MNLNQVIDKRIGIFQQIQAQQESELQSRPHDPIKIMILNNWSVKEGKKWVSTPMDIAQGISDSFAANALISSVKNSSVDNGVLWEMNRPFEGDCEIKFFTFKDDVGRNTFWRSSALILGQCLESIYGCQPCSGPCTTRGQEGFYYDAFCGGLNLNEDHFRHLNDGALRAAAEKQPIERIEVTREQALEIFSDNNFKVELINQSVDKTFTVYRCGRLVDLCHGPHLPNTSFVKAFACLKASPAYWNGNKDRGSLQRVYGISFPNEKRLKKHIQRIEAPKKYDHMLLGTKQDPLSPGSWVSHHDRGARVCNKLMDFIKDQYWRRGYEEVTSSPHLPSSPTGKKKVEKQEFGLTGLTPVRGFHQGNAHIFCRESQIKEEVKGVLNFIDYFYSVFGFTNDLKLSTRPEKYLGDLATWERAEAALTEALNESGKEWQINGGDGDFYGPKIDTSVSNAFGRKYQCATTLQLDFRLPDLFELEYEEEDEAKWERPVMIHTAIMGSVERMFAILLEHYHGKWPFWLSPRQAIVISVSKNSHDYAKKVHELIHEAGYHVDIDLTDGMIRKKVREAQLARVNYILVVGEEESKTNTVSVRLRFKEDYSSMSIEGLLQHFKDETEAFH